MSSPGVAQLHELLGFVPELDSLEPDEHADAVIDVHDQVVHFQIAEVGEERAGGRPPALMNLALLLEDVGLGPDLQRRVRQPETAREVARAHEHCGCVRICGPLDRNREDLVIGQQLDGPLGTAG